MASLRKPTHLWLGQSLAVYSKTPTRVVLGRLESAFTLRREAKHVKPGQEIENCSLLMRRRSIRRAGSQRSDRLRGYILAERRQGRFECNLQHLVHRIHEVHLHGVAQIFGNLGQVFFVVAGEDDFEESSAVSGQQFFLKPADGKDLAAERDFTGHGQIAAYRNLAESAS